MKGADVVMQTIVQYNDWLEEEVKGHDFVKEIQNFNFEQIYFIFIFLLVVSLQCGNMAREGLRTLVVAKKILTEEQYQEFDVSLQKIELSSTGSCNFMSNINLDLHFMTLFT